MGKKVGGMRGARSQTSPSALVFAAWKDSLWLKECGRDERVPSFNYTLAFTFQLSKTKEKFSQGTRKLLPRHNSFCRLGHIFMGSLTSV